MWERNFPPRPTQGKKAGTSQRDWKSDDGTDRVGYAPLSLISAWEKEGPPSIPEKPYRILTELSFLAIHFVNWLDEQTKEPT
jgi:hypothetical protein